MSLSNSNDHKTCTHISNPVPASSYLTIGSLDLYEFNGLFFSQNYFEMHSTAPYKLPMAIRDVSEGLSLFNRMWHMVI